jgi:hypothetical protein
MEIRPPSNHDSALPVNHKAAGSLTKFSFVSHFFRTKKNFSVQVSNKLATTPSPDLLEIQSEKQLIELENFASTCHVEEARRKTEKGGHAKKKGISIE